MRLGRRWQLEPGRRGSLRGDEPRLAAPSSWGAGLPRRALTQWQLKPGPQLTAVPVRLSEVTVLSGHGQVGAIILTSPRRPPNAPYESPVLSLLLCSLCSSECWVASADSESIMMRLLQRFHRPRSCQCWGHFKLPPHTWFVLNRLCGCSASRARLRTKAHFGDGTLVPNANLT